jgi:hypothetical protein
LQWELARIVFVCLMVVGEDLHGNSSGVMKAETFMVLGIPGLSVIYYLLNMILCSTLMWFSYLSEYGDMLLLPQGIFNSVVVRHLQLSMAVLYTYVLLYMTEQV